MAFPEIYESPKSAYKVTWWDGGTIDWAESPGSYHRNFEPSISWEATAGSEKEASICFAVGWARGTFGEMQPANTRTAIRWANAAYGAPELIPLEYYAIVTADRVKRDFKPKSLANPRTRNQWEGLSSPYRKRLLGAGRRRGLTEAETEQLYLSGASLEALRGHGNTPEQPDRALFDPIRWKDWLRRHPRTLNRRGTEAMIARIVLNMTRWPVTRWGQIMVKP